MSKQPIKRVVLLWLAIGAGTPACNQPATNNPTNPSSSGVTTMEIIGPSTVAPGKTAQLNVNMRLADGTTKIASTNTSVQWRSSNSSVLQVNQNGLLTPTAASGESNITVSITGGRSATREIVVTPDGTYRLVGNVSEEGAPSISISKALVEVVSGEASTTTDVSGNYRLYGVPPSAEIRVSANAYGTTTFPVQLSANTTRNFALPLTGQRPSLGGVYTLAIDYTGPCTGFSPTLPTELRHRTYDAAVSQSGANLDVMLLSSSFRVNGAAKGNHFGGLLINGGARFFLEVFGYYYYYNYPSIAEQLPNGTFLVIQGTAVTSGSPGTSLVGTIPSGAMWTWDSKFPKSDSRLLAACFGQMSFRLDPR